MDGVLCHWAAQCREEGERRPDDPEPSWHSEKAGQSLEIECKLGEHYKIHERLGDRREGWTGKSGVNVTSPNPVRFCELGDF